MEEIKNRAKKKGLDEVNGWAMYYISIGTCIAVLLVSCIIKMGGILW